jgi:hypothetical protein
MDTEESREQLWHRLDNESGRAYEAFKVYMYLPPGDRTPLAAWRSYSGNPNASKTPPYFFGWGKDYAWSERARAHDHHLEVIRESGMEQAIKEEAARQARAAEQTRFRFHELMTIAYQRAIESLESDGFVEQLRPSDVIQILKTHLETTHKLGGSETDTLGGAAAVDWTEDEQRELDRILDEIESETAQEEEVPGPESGESDGSGEDPKEQP